MSNPPDGQGGLRRRAVTASIVSAAGFGGKFVVQFVRNVVLARLLFPEAFGLMSLVRVLINGLEMLSDTGVRQSIIQNPRGDDPVFLNTAWTIRVIRGFVLFGITALIAWPYAQFYEQPSLLGLLLVSGLTPVIMGFTSTSLLSQERQLRMGLVVGLQLLTGITTFIVAAVIAWIHPTVWALVFGGLAGAAARTIASHFVVKGYRNRFQWDPESFKAIYKFGRWIVLTTALTFLALQSDTIILGKLIPMAMLGVYTIAYSVSNVPRALVKVVAGRVIFPAVSRRADIPRHALREKILRNRIPLLAAFGGGVAIMVVYSDLVVRLIYDERYHEAARIVPVLSLGLWPRVLANTIGPSLLALGKPQYNALGSILRLIVIAIGLPVGYFSFGLYGAVTVMALADVPNYIAILIGLRKERLLSVKQDVLSTAAFAAVLALFLGSRHLIGLDLPFPFGG